MSIIMENAIRGATRQEELAIDAGINGDIELAEQHWEAAELLWDFSKDYIPCLSEEL